MEAEQKKKKIPAWLAEEINKRKLKAAQGAPPLPVLSATPLLFGWSLLFSIHSRSLTSSPQSSVVLHSLGFALPLCPPSSPIPLCILLLIPVTCVEATKALQERVKGGSKCSDGGEEEEEEDGSLPGVRRALDPLPRSPSTSDSEEEREDDEDEVSRARQAAQAAEVRSQLTSILLEVTNQIFGMWA